MNKSILLLIMIGVVLAVVHVPEFVITVGLIAFLAIAAIKLLWAMLTPFSHPSRRKTQPRTFVSSY